MGVGGLMLARATGVEGFAAPSLLLVVNSVAVTLADQGLGTDLLRLGPSEVAPVRRLRTMRSLNAAVLGVGLVLGWALGGDAGLLVGGSGCMWAAAAESYVRRSGAIRQGAIRSVVAGEVLGSAALGLAFVAACWEPDAAAVILVAGLVAKNMIEGVLARRWRLCFATDGRTGDQLSLWLAQVVAYLIANMDFVVVGLLLGERSFAVYTLAFRLSNALPSQLAYVAGRTASVDLATSVSDRAEVYRRYVAPLFGFGLGAAALTAVAAPVAPWVLGDGWASITGVLLVLAVAVPWRMILGLGGTLLIVSRQADRLLRIELTHAVVLASALVVGAWGGFGPLTAVASSGSVLSVMYYHGVAAKWTGITRWKPLTPAAIASLALVAVLVIQVATPG